MVFTNPLEALKKKTNIFDYVSNNFSVPEEEEKFTTPIPKVKTPIVPEKKQQFMTPIPKATPAPMSQSYQSNILPKTIKDKTAQDFNLQPEIKESNIFEPEENFLQKSKRQFETAISPLEDRQNLYKQYGNTASVVGKLGQSFLSSLVDASFSTSRGVVDLGIEMATAKTKMFINDAKQQGDILEKIDRFQNSTKEGIYAVQEKYYNDRPRLKEMKTKNQTEGVIDTLDKRDREGLGNKMFSVIGQSFPSFVTAIATKKPAFVFATLFPQMKDLATEDLKADKSLRLTNAQINDASSAIGAITSLIETVSVGTQLKPFLKSVNIGSTLKSAFVKAGAIKKGVVQMAKSMGAESIEEVAQQMVQNASAIGLGSDRDFGTLKDYAKIAIESFILGFGISVPGGVMEGIQQNELNKIIEKDGGKTKADLDRLFDIMSSPSVEENIEVDPVADQEMINKEEMNQVDPVKYQTIQSGIPENTRTGIQRYKNAKIEDVVEKSTDISLDKDIVIKDIQGNSFNLKEGTALTPYRMIGGKVLLQNGETYIVPNNQFLNIKNQSTVLEAKEFAPELKGTEERTLGQKDTTSLTEELKNLGYTIEADMDGESILDKNGEMVEYEDLDEHTQYVVSKISNAVEGNPTKYEKYTLPGGKNYREVLIKAPKEKQNVPKLDWQETIKGGQRETKGPTRDYSITENNGQYSVSKRGKGETFGTPFAKRSTLEDAKNEVNNSILNEMKSPDDFTSSHRDDKNVLSHLRLNEREYDGKKVTFMEELQSDWAREARKGATEAKDERLKNRQTLTIKRALQEAVENGSEYFSWINGEQTAERYSLEKHLDRIDRDIVGNKGDKKVYIHPKGGNLLNIIVNSNGEITQSVERSWVGKNVSDVLGKGLGEQIIGNKEGVVDGNGLKIGGERAYNMYDKQVPNIVKDLTGQTAEKTDLGRSIKLTPEVKAIVKGQAPLRAKPSGKPIEEVFVPEIYQIFNQATKQPISKDEALKIVRKYFDADELSVNFAKKISTPEGLLAFGKYVNGVITMIESPDISTPRHEVIHAYLDLFISKERKNDILQDVMKSVAYSDYLNGAKPSKESAEEFLADKGNQYLINKEMPSNISQKIIDFLRDILNDIKRFFGKENKMIDLFNDIQNKNRDYISDKFGGTTKYEDFGNNTKSNQFKAWFGDWENDPENSSKVVDEDGNPLVVYHGTTEDFNIFGSSEFKNESSSIGTWFVDKKIVSDKFANTEVVQYFYKDPKTGKEVITQEKTDAGGRIGGYKEVIVPEGVDVYYRTIKRPKTKSVYLDIKNPKIYKSSTDGKIDSFEEMMDHRDKITGATYMVGTKRSDRGAPYQEKEQTSKEFVDYLKSEGYDGIILENTEYDGGGEKSMQYVAFNPTQIKSATENVGTYDQNNPDIRYQVFDEKKYYESIQKSIRSSSDKEYDNFAYRVNQIEKREQNLGYMFGKKISDPVVKQKQKMEFLRDRSKLVEEIGQHYNLDQFESELKYDEFTSLSVDYLDGLTAPRAKYEPKTEEEKIVKKQLIAIKERNNQLLAEKKAEKIDAQIQEKIAPKKKLIKEKKAEKVDKTEEVIVPKDFASVYEKEIDKGEFKESTGKGIKQVIKDILAPISTEIGKIAPELKYKLRRQYSDTQIAVISDLEGARKFLDFGKKLSGKDYSDLTFALFNGDLEKTNEILNKYNVSLPRKVLDGIYERAKEQSFELGYEKNYFPRVVKDPAGLLEALQGKDESGFILRAIKEKEFSIGRILTIEEKANIANSMLRGFGTQNITIGSKNFKQRGVDLVTKDLVKYYYEPFQGLIRYIEGVNDAIEMKRFFGGQNPEDSIGAITMKLLGEGKITPEQENTLRKLLLARFNQSTMNGAISAYRDMTYIAVMGNPISAVTQIGDLAWSMYQNGWIRGMKSLFGKKMIKKEDIGINELAREFSDGGKLQKTLNKIFKQVGISWMDSVGKETFINSSFDKYVYEANKDPKKLKEKLISKGFPEIEIDKIIDDLQNKIVSSDVKFLLFNDIADFQPLGPTEMPKAYLMNPNTRIMYMLKTFTIKQLDVIRREIYDQMKTNPKQGLKNLIRLAGALMIFNATADTIKSFMLGRKISLPDMIIDNIMRLFGFSKYQIYKAKTDGVLPFLQAIFLPPTSLVDNPRKDIVKATSTKNGLEFKDAKTLQLVPYVGKLYYWRMGGASGDDKKSTSLKKKGDSLKKGGSLKKKTKSLKK